MFLWKKSIIFIDPTPIDFKDYFGVLMVKTYDNIMIMSSSSSYLLNDSFSTLKHGQSKRHLCISLNKRICHPTRTMLVSRLVKEKKMKRKKEPSDYDQEDIKIYIDLLVRETKMLNMKR